MAEKRREAAPEAESANRQPKVVAEMPDDAEMREKIEEWKKTDGYPGSCGAGL